MLKGSRDVAHALARLEMLEELLCIAVECSRALKLRDDERREAAAQEKADLANAPGIGEETVDAAGVVDLELGAGSSAESYEAAAAEEATMPVISPAASSQSEQILFVREGASPEIAAMRASQKVDRTLVRELLGKRPDGGPSVEPPAVPAGTGSASDPLIPDLADGSCDPEAMRSMFRMKVLARIEFRYHRDIEGGMPPMQAYFRQRSALKSAMDCTYACEILPAVPPLQLLGLLMWFEGFVLPGGRLCGVWGRRRRVVLGGLMGRACRRTPFVYCIISRLVVRSGP